ncbi:MAG TPA: hypothetical protein VGC79_00075 [Polyangiaceae bacterium]
MLRTLEWASELRAGELYPRWASDFYGGYGSPFFIFYAPAVYAIAALLMSVFTVFWALKLVALAAMIAPGVGTFALVYVETRESNAAFLAAIAYLASPYRLLDLYERGDLSEFTAISLLPVALALYRAAAKEAIPWRASCFLVAAAGCHALMVLSHTILGFWGTIIIGLVVAASAAFLASRGLWRRAGRLLIALCCAPGLAAVYLAPALAYRELTRMQVMTIGFANPQNQLNRISVLFADHTVMFSRSFLQIGPLLSVSAFLTLLGLALDFRAARRALGWVALTLFLVMLTLPIASGVWAPGRFPLLQFIQFPWRLLGPASLTASVALGIGAAAACNRLGKTTQNGVVIALATAILCVIALPAVGAPEVAPNGVPNSLLAIRRGTDTSTTNGDEYLPLAAPAPPSTPAKALVKSASEATVEHTESKASRHYLTIAANRAGATVELALHAFPGWRVSTRSGPDQATLDTDSAGLIRLNLPTPGQYKLKVSYGITPAGAFGAALSALSLAILAVLLMRDSAWFSARLASRLDVGGAA